MLEVVNKNILNVLLIIFKVTNKDATTTSIGASMVPLWLTLNTINRTIVYLAKIYLLKFNKRSTKKSCEICVKFFLLFMFLIIHIYNDIKIKLTK